ncbi:hypothetical protein OG241_00680 [Streptomyces sp. NBC_01390]|uniref:hypothetical protein n=1 Tax=Streptomyces sp. NBC_01390 TaxID=2903850 RepID=UPI0032432AF7
MLPLVLAGAGDAEEEAPPARTHAELLSGQPARLLTGIGPGLPVKRSTKGCWDEACSACGRVADARRLWKIDNG